MTTTTNTTSTHYALYHVGHGQVDGLGTGATRSEACAAAVADAAARSGTPADALEGEAVPCTRGLYDHVDSAGGQSVGWRTRDGIAYRDESELA